MKRLIATACLLFVGCAAEPNDGKLIGLRTNLEVQPVSIEEQSPSFSWQLQTASAEGQQSAYQVTVFDVEGTSIWDSGRVNTSQAANVAYSGPDLMPEQRYRWQVSSWLESGATALGESWFETGLMNPEQSAWEGAQWIGGSATDKVFNADYLSVYKVAVDLQLDEASQQAAFLLGGNDYRLQNANLNIRQVASKADDSFVAFELDVSGLQQADGQAQLHIYRVGYAAEDSLDKPLFSLPIPTSLVNASNQHSPHTIYIDCEFGLFNIHIDGRDQANNITPVDPSLSPYDTTGLNLNPAGRGNNYLSYPMLAEIGFWLKPAQSALFSKVEVRNFRAPSNVIFAAGADDSSAHQNIFAGQSDQLTVSDAGIKVSATDESVVILADPSRDGTPMLRHQFTLADKGIAQARLHATARGVYEMYINGQRVGSDYFAPGLTQYNKHHTYQTYDVTELLNAGDNVVGALLGEGWWSGNITYTGANWNYFGDQQSLLGKLVVTFADGSQQTITTQPESWQVFHDGPIRLGSFFQGEIYDARKESAVAGWSSPGYQNDQWHPAAVVPIQGTAFLGDPQQNRDNQLITSYQDMKLVAHPGNSPQIVETLQAKSVEEVRPGVFVYDMGQNMVGFPRIELGSAAGDGPVLLRYAEVRYPDLPEHAGLEGMIMMENFRAALVNDTYYPKGDNDVIQPRFTFHGYRFIEISGITEPLPIESVQGLVVSSVQQLSAHYETSNELVNKLWQNITWSMRGNFLSIPTDTPARNERMGWNGDLNVFAGTALYMADINAFIERHLWALRDIQAQSGRFADVAPVGGGFGGTLWGSAGVIVPWQNYLRYQDISLLQDHYPAMVSYIDFLQSKIDAETGVLIEGPLGDWLSPEGGKNDNTLLWEAYHVHLLAIMQQAAELLEQPEDQARFAQLYQQRKAFFNRTYVDATTGKTVSSVVQTGFGKPTSIDSSNAGKLVDTQASYAIPIAFNVFDESNLPRAQRHLAATVTRSKQDDAGTERPPYSLMTGFIGTASLSEALSLAGHDDLAYRLLQQTSYPSWLYSVVNGATTIWERLNSYTREQGFGGNNSMNSFNHYSFGAVGSWMMGRSLGIRRSEGKAGYQRFDLAPTPDPTGQMSWAQGHYDSPFGRIQSRWAVEEEGTRYQFTVPENTQATLYLPATAGATVTGPELDYQQSGARRMYRLAPGDYTFSVKQ